MEGAASSVRSFLIIHVTIHLLLLKELTTYINVTQATGMQHSFLKMDAFALTLQFNPIVMDFHSQRCFLQGRKGLGEDLARGYNHFPNLSSQI